MKFLLEDEFDPKPGKVRELAHWLKTHDEKLRLACPKGVVYLGAFAVVQTTGPEGRDIRLGWGMESRSAMDAFDAATSAPGLLRHLLDELHQFADGGTRWHRGGRTLLTSIVS